MCGDGAILKPGTGFLPFAAACIYSVSCISIPNSLYATMPYQISDVHPIRLDHVPDIRLIACDMDGTLLDDDNAILFTSEINKSGR